MVHWSLNQLQIVPGFCSSSESAGNEQHWRVLVHNVGGESPWAGQKADFEDGRVLAVQTSAGAPRLGWVNAVVS